MKTFLTNMVQFASSHGYDVIIEGSKVVVSDRDGYIVTDSIIELRRWMGY
jgi:hypothetical protein